MPMSKQNPGVNPGSIKNISPVPENRACRKWTHGHSLREIDVLGLCFQIKLGLSECQPDYGQNPSQNPSAIP